MKHEIESNLDDIYITDRPETLASTIVSRKHLYKPGLREQWANEKAEIITTLDGEEILRINEFEVMRGFEKPYMTALAKIATSQGGRILNVGYGLGYVDAEIEKFRTSCNLHEHYIIELNTEVYERACRWREKQPHKEDIVIKQGDWKNVLEELRAQDLTFRGVVYDAFPLDTKELHRDFLPFLVQIMAIRLVEEHQGIITCYMDSIDGFGNQFKLLLKHLGVGKAHIEKVPVELPKDGTQYWTKPFFFVPVLTDIAYP